jgi:hypothetical protein
MRLHHSLLLYRVLIVCLLHTISFKHKPWHGSSRESPDKRHDGRLFHAIGAGMKKPPGPFSRGGSSEGAVIRPGR